MLSKGYGPSRFGASDPLRGLRAWRTSGLGPGGWETGQGGGFQVGGGPPPGPGRQARGAPLRHPQRPVGIRARDSREPALLLSTQGLGAGWGPSGSRDSHLPLGRVASSGSDTASLPETARAQRVCGRETDCRESLCLTDTSRGGVFLVCGLLRGMGSGGRGGRGGPVCSLGTGASDAA